MTKVRIKYPFVVNTIFPKFLRDKSTFAKPFSLLTPLRTVLPSIENMPVVDGCHNLRLQSKDEVKAEGEGEKEGEVGEEDEGVGPQHRLVHVHVQRDGGVRHYPHQDQVQLKKMTIFLQKQFWG